MAVVEFAAEAPTVRAVRGLCSQTRALVGALDPSLLSTDDATRLVREFVELEKLAAAGKTVLAARATEGDLWKRAGDKSPGHWLARKGGTSLAAAERTLTTSEQVAELDATWAALVDGELSPDQAAAVAAGATADPRAEDEMLRHALVDPLHQLRERAEAKKAAGDPDPEATRARIHASRFAKRSRCADGAERIEIRDNPDVIAGIWFRAKAFADPVFDQARREGRRESHDNYMADAFAAMARAATNTATTGTGSAAPDTGTKRPKHNVSRKPLFILMADLASVVRGRGAPGETVEIPGFGPYPVEAARQLLHSDAVIQLVLTHGTDPRCVVTDTRHVAPAVRAALWPRDRRCVVPGCGRTAGLEIHHTHSANGYAHTHQTRLDLLGLVCDHHHDDITYRGATLTGNHQDGWHYQPPPPDRHNQRSPYSKHNNSPPNRN
jgi:hypothetical protein